MPNNLVGERPFCAVFQKTPGSEKVLEKKGEYQKFSWKVFCLTVPKNVVGEQRFCAKFQRISGSEKVLKKRGKEYQKFQSKVFLSHSAEQFGRETTLLCCVPEIFR